MIEDLTFDFINLLREKPIIRRVLLYTSIVYLLIFVIIANFFPLLVKDQNREPFNVLAAVSAGLITLILISYTKFEAKKNTLTSQLTSIKVEREKIIERIQKKDNNVVDTIYLSLNQLTEYYTINLSQARTSYRWSIAAIIIGLLTLIGGAWLIFFKTNPSLTVGIITSISGLLIEFIGASNIYIYNKSLSQLNLYFKELLNIQDTMLAIELCEKIDDSNPKKIEIKEKIILSLMSRSSVKGKYK